MTEDREPIQELAVIVDHFAGSVARRLRFVQNGQKWLETKRWMNEMMIIMVLPYNVGLYGLVFFSP